MPSVPPQKLEKHVMFGGAFVLKPEIGAADRGNSNQNVGLKSENVQAPAAPPGSGKPPEAVVGSGGDPDYGVENLHCCACHAEIVEQTDWYCVC